MWSSCRSHTRNHLRFLADDLGCEASCDCHADQSEWEWKGKSWVMLHTYYQVVSCFDVMLYIVRCISCYLCVTCLKIEMYCYAVSNCILFHRTCAMVESSLKGEKIGFASNCNAQSIGQFGLNIDKWSMHTEWLGHCLLPTAKVDTEDKEYSNPSDH